MSFVMQRVSTSERPMAANKTITFYASLPRCHWMDLKLHRKINLGVSSTNPEIISVQSDRVLSEELGGQ